MMQDTGYKIKAKNHASGIVHRASCIMHRNRDGVTLIEMVIVMVLMGLVALVVANVFSTGVKGSIVTDYRKEGLDQARVAIERMRREIRNLRSSSAADLSVANATTFTFVDTEGTSISFELSGVNINRTSGSANILSTGISSIGDATFPTGIFRYVLSTGTETQTPSAAEMLTIKRIKIGFKATVGTESVQLQTTVYPRNL